MAGQPKNGILLGTAGVRTNVSDYLRPPNALKVGNNVNMITRGVITSRYSGWSRQRQSTFNSGAQFLDFGVFTDNTGLSTLCFQCGDTIFSYTSNVETAIKAGNSTVNPPCFRSYTPYSSGTPLLLYANGTDQPTKITGIGGAAWAALQLNGGNYPQPTAAPLPVRTYGKPKFIEPFLDRVLIAGFPDATTAFDVLVTNSGTCETVSQSASPAATDGGIFTLNPALGPITGMKAFKLSNQTNDQVVLIGQARGVSVLTGNSATATGSLTPFKLFTLTTEYGIPSNRCWTQIQNDLYFLASDGLRCFSSLSQNANLLNASMSFDIQDLIIRINSASAQWAFMAHHRNYLEVALWVPLDSATTNNHAIVVNYNVNDDAGTKNWFPQQVVPIFFTKDGTAVSCGIYFNGTFYGGGYTGILQQHYSGQLYDTTPVQWEITASFIKPDDPEMVCTLERATVMTEGAAQSYLCNAFAYLRQGNYIVRKQVNPINFPIATTAPGTTVLGTWILGSSGLPGSFWKTHYFEPQGAAAHMWELQLLGTQSTHVIDWLGTKWRITEGGVQS